MVILLVAFLVVSISARQFSVSGVSSGAAMAIQLHISHSSDVVGAGIIAGPPYYCAQGSSILATTSCMTTPYLINLNSLLQYAQEQSKAGTIDNLSNLTSNTTGVFIFSGLLDTVVNQLVVRQVEKFYGNFISSSKIYSIYSVSAEHAWVTNFWGSACVYLGLPFVNNCLVDGAGLILKQIYGSLQPSVATVSHNLISFDQTKYVNPVAGVMANTGYIYIPTNCQSSPDTCRVHLALHGCSQNFGTVAYSFILENGLNGYAESNNIIIIYPQTSISLSKNPEGCWDWWGFTGYNYALKSGIQISALYQMTQNLPLENLINLDN